jgi:hypothetical protein
MLIVFYSKNVFFSDQTSFHARSGKKMIIIKNIKVIKNYIILLLNIIQ